MVRQRPTPSCWSVKKRKSTSANASVIRYQAIWNPHNVFWYWTNENSNNVTGV